MSPLKRMACQDVCAANLDLSVPLSLYARKWVAGDMYLLHYLEGVQSNYKMEKKLTWKYCLQRLSLSRLKGWSSTGISCRLRGPSIALLSCRLVELKCLGSFQMCSDCLRFNNVISENWKAGATTRPRICSI